MQPRALLLLLFVLSASACASAWAPRSIPACYAPSATPELERERSYYATLLALSERKYVIVHADAPRQIEVEYQSSYQPEQAYARWLIDVGEDASLHVQSLPADALVSRKRSRRLAQWFELLSSSARRLQCRDLNWLRWEAQNRGLVPMAEGLLTADAPEGPDSLKDQALSPSVSPEPDLLAPSERVRQARRQELERERKQTSLVAPIALMGIGAGLLGGAVGFAELAAFNLGPECTHPETSDSEGSCLSSRQQRNFAIGAGALALASIGLIAAGAPLLARRARRQREIGRELRALEAPRLSLGTDAHGLSLSFRTRF